jgi:cellulose synthase/poly-beta-1,6-N-acetylglucosamine synthase-like glycosyltransferase
MEAIKTTVLVLYFSILTILSIYGAHRLWTIFLYYRHKKDVPQPKDVPGFEPHVTVQLAVFNEMNVVERLVDHVVRMDWPKEKLEIQLLDDSTDDTVKVGQAVCEKYRRLGFDIQYIHRVDRTGFKAGALDNGLKTAKGEVVAMFDADFLPTPDFLRKAVPHFADDKVAFVQGCWDHVNREFSLLTQVQAIFLDGHFVFEHTARNRSHAFFNFNGTAGMWRVKAIADAGGWQHDTITEDTDLSYRAQLKGWRGVYLKDLVVPAELPVEMNAFKSQQHRWAKGLTQVIRKLIFTILRSKEGFHVKAEAWMHLSANCNYILMVVLTLLMVPSMIIRTGTPFKTLVFTDGIFFTLNAVSVGLYYGLSQKELHDNRGWKSRLVFIPCLMSLGIGLALNQAKAVLEGFFTRDVEFVRTPKLGVDASGQIAKKQTYKVPKSVVTFLEAAFALYYLAAIVVSIAIKKYASLPFLILFFNGFAYITVLSLLDTRLFRRFATEELSDAQDATEPLH